MESGGDAGAGESRLLDRRGHEAVRLHVGDERCHVGKRRGVGLWNGNRLLGAGDVVAEHTRAGRTRRDLEQAEPQAGE